MNKVLVFGTFDLVHPGHVHFFTEAKKFGDELFVVVARDETVLKVKGKLPLHDEQERLRQIKSLDIVNKAILGNKDDKFKVIEELKPNVICIGYDQNSFNNNLQDELLKRKLNIKVIKFEKGHFPEFFKSSKIKDKFGL